jgi:hypothetical protein
MKPLFFLLLLVLGQAAFAATGSDAKPTWPEQLERVERRVDRLYSGLASAGLLAGAVCALWAQNTGRNAWLWFFGAFLFSFFALLFMLHKNSTDLRRRPPQAGKIGND